MKTRNALFLLVLLSLVSIGSASDLYPPLSKWSVGDLASQTMRRIASGAELPPVGSASVGELFLRFPQIDIDPELPGMSYCFSQRPGLFMKWEIATWTYDFGGYIGPKWLELGQWDTSRLPRGRDLPAAGTVPGQLFLKFGAEPELWVSSYTNGPLGWDWNWLQCSGGTGGGSGVATHSLLADLDFESSGHTGFARATDIPQVGSFDHDLLFNVATSAAHDARYDARYAIPGNANVWTASNTFFDQTTIYLTYIKTALWLNATIGGVFDIAMENAEQILQIKGGPADSNPRIVIFGTDGDLEKRINGGIEIRAFKNGSRVWGSGGTTFWTLDESSTEARRFAVTASGAIKLFPLSSAPSDADVAENGAMMVELQNGSAYFDGSTQHFRIVASNSWNDLGFAGGEADREFQAKTLLVESLIATSSIRANGGYLSASGTAGITRTVDIPWNFGVSSWSIQIENGLIVGVTTP